jgi:cardiolipin synthase
LFSSLIACAQHELVLSTPYFVPDATVLGALCSAAHRGVRVTLIFPKRNDSWVVAAASRSYYRTLLTAGCEIHEFKGGLLHAKTLTIDDKITFVGSSNLDLRSFDLNYENNILLQDTTTTLNVRARQESYTSQSEAIGLEQVLNWPRHMRIWHNVIATFGPVL